MTDRPPTLGILGAGQLAAMMTDAANRIGIDVHVLRPTESDDRAPGNQLTTASFDDSAAVLAFAETVDAVTVETENVPTETLRMLEPIVAVHPSADVIEIVQDRLLEKQFLTANDIPTAFYVAVGSAEELATASESLGGPGIIKTRRFGYDGKGQARVNTPADAAGAWDSHGAGPSILEALVPFDCEISVVAGRSAAGDIAMFDPGRNEHRGGILHQTQVPAAVDRAVEEEAKQITRTILEAFNYVGVMGVEFFLTGSDLVVNEIAPRVHNSGHWTQQGCVVDQFEQHVRAVMGLALGSPERHCDVVTTNIMGDDVSGLTTLLDATDTRVHLYGKREARPGRKMGHTNTVYARS